MRRASSSRITALGVGLALLSCGAPRQGPGHGPFSPPSSRVFEAAFHEVPEGQRPPGFSVVEASASFPWIYDGGWRVVRPDPRTAVLEVPLARTDVAEPLTFFRFGVEAFGAPGVLPSRFRLSATARSLGGARRFGGFGEVAIQVAYFSPVTYVEVLQTDRDLMVWQAHEAAPMQGAGWTLLASTPHPVAVGQWFSFWAEVDRTTGLITAQASRSARLTATSSLLPSATEPGLTLRATGNREQFRVLRIEELTPPATATKTAPR